MPETTQAGNAQRAATPAVGDGFDPEATCQGRRGPVLFWSVAAALGMIGSSLVLKLTGISGAAEFAVSMVPVPLLGAMYWAMFRVVQNVDEMQRKMKLEALGLTVIVSSLIFFTIGQLERVGVYEPEDFSDAWLIITFAFLACSGLVHLRYRF